MQEVFNYSNGIIDRVKLEFKRYLFHLINWNSRLIEILGARGVGKTTLMLQKSRLLNSEVSNQAVQISLDDKLMFNHSIVDVADGLEKQGVKYLEKAEVVNTIMQKPDKIYLANTNFSYGLNMLGEEMGTIRETFFNSQLGTAHELRLPEKGDFLVDGKYLFEVGGTKKTFKQIKDLNNAYIAVDDIETGAFNQIPLWLLGFLY